MNQRDISIDILKFIAVFLIINSHMDALYPKYKMLATGGAIGDVLFLFASGYTLFLSNRKLRFDNWYKRRINRIYPSVIVCAIIGTLFSEKQYITLLSMGGGEFVIVIMCYYILLYFIKEYCIRYIPQLLLLTAFISGTVYYFWFPYKYETGEQGLYGISTLFRWIPYFGFMLLGAWMGIKREFLKFRPKIDFLNMIICLILFYGIQLIAKKQPIYAPWQIITLIPLMGIVYFFYKWCNANFWKKLYAKSYVHAIIMTTSGICLESYLIQFSLFTTKMNELFPLNLFIMTTIILVVSFLCKCLSQWFIQTFNDKDYDWKEIIKPY